MAQRFSQNARTPHRQGRLSLLSCLWIVAISTFASTPLSVDLASRLEWSVLFKLRDFLRKAPELDPKIKIFAFDDLTVGELQSSRLTYSQWANILKKIDSQNPKSILIDAMFSINEQTVGTEDIDQETLKTTLREMDTPVYVGAFTSVQDLPGRQKQSLNDRSFQLESYLPFSPKIGESINSYPLADKKKHFVYGPIGDLQDSFRGIGHILSGPFPGTFYPALELDGQRVLRHLSLLPFDGFQILPGQLRIESKNFPVMRNGISLINYPSRDEMRGQIKSLRSLFADQDSEITLQSIGKEDIVVLLPLYFTGSVDFKPTPIGIIPGGFNHIAILNSIVTENLLRKTESDGLVCFILGAISLLLGFALSARFIVSVCITGVIIWAMTVVLVFAYFSYVLPWILPTFSLVTVLGFWLRLKINEAEVQHRFLHQALDGYVEPKLIKALESHPEQMPLEARERVLTIMFVDIVGFSLIVENQTPRAAFDSLKDIIESVSKVVHEHGGVINKTLGDGLLCFFGYSFFSDKEELGHADQALHAAIAIQRLNVQRMLDLAETGSPIFPLRIGINTSAVYLGNIGSGEHFDLTIIGNGVNFAKRLEGACSSHHVLLSQTSKELVDFRSAYVAKRRLISIKHHSDLLEAWEYDPFIEDPDLKRRADDLFEHLAYITRLEKRWFVPKEASLILLASFGYGRVLDFSSSGLCFETSVSLLRGQRVDVELKSENPDFHARLESLGIQILPLQIRWVRIEDKMVICGSKFVDLDEKKLATLVEILCQYHSQETDSIEQNFGS